MQKAYLEYIVVFFLSIVTFFLGSYVLTGGLPRIDIPILYDGDGTFTTFFIKNIMNGNAYESMNIGYPYGSYFSEYPVPDFFNTMLLRLVSLFASSPFAVMNIFIYLTYPMVFVGTYIACRLFNLDMKLSLFVAFVYSFTPFHWMKAGHVFYLQYVCVPFFFYVGYLLTLNVSKIELKKILLLSVAMIFLSLFGVYYTFFGLLVIGLSGIIGSLQNKTIKNFIIAMLLCAISASVIYTLTFDSGRYVAEYGANTKHGQRQHPPDSEIYGLKLVQMLLPQHDHIVPGFREISREYMATFPLVNENVTSVLGLIGAIGLLGVFISICLLYSKYKVDERINFFSFTALVLFIWTTVGGLSSLFSLLITPQLRGWNRVSIFIAFAAIMLFTIYFKQISQNWKPVFKIFLLLVFSVVAFVDQSPGSKRTLINNTFVSDKSFFTAMESRVPKNAAIFQLPYMGFPEVPSVYDMAVYAPMVGYLHTNHLKFSYGGFKGREADLLYEQLARLPVDKLIEILKQMGYNGIHINKLGYQDGADKIIRELEVLLNKKADIISEDGLQVFFAIEPTSLQWSYDPKESNYVGLDDALLMVDKLATPVEFDIEYALGLGWIEQVKLRGIGVFEGGHVWTHSSNPSICFVLPYDSSNKDKYMILNANFLDKSQKAVVFINDKEITNIDSTMQVPYRIKIPDFIESGEYVKIDFKIDRPMTPLELGINGDRRPLGLSLKSVKFINND